MNISEQIEHTRSVCESALVSPAMSAVRRFVEGRELTTDAMIALLHECSKLQAPTPELISHQESVTAAGIGAPDPTVFARTMLVTAALRSLDRIPGLGVDDSVRQLFCEEFRYYAEPPEAARSNFDVTKYPFFVMGKIALLDRFPGGQQHWEISGFPRSWLAKTSVAMLPRLLWFLATKAGGIRPYFVPHMAVGKTKPRFLLERDYRKSFYRMAAAIELQPEIRAIMGASWLHSAETHRVSPHLAFLNQPYLEAGGIYVEVGKPPDNAGFRSGDKEREELYRTGQYRPTVGLVICSREQAMEWKRKNSEIESSLAR